MNMIKIIFMSFILFCTKFCWLIFFLIQDCNFRVFFLQFLVYATYSYLIIPSNLWQENYTFPKEEIKCLFTFLPVFPTSLSFFPHSFNPLIHGRGGGRCTPSPLCFFAIYSKKSSGNPYLKICDLTQYFFADEEKNTKFSFTPSHSTHGTPSTK